MRQVDSFHIGDVLRTAFSVYSRNPLAFYLIGLIGYLPVFVVDMHYEVSAGRALGEVESTPQLPTAGQFLTSQLAYQLAYMLSSTWMAAALTYSVVRFLRTGQVNILQAWPQIVRALPRVLVAAVLAGLAVGFGTLLFVVPGIVLALMFWVAPEAAVVEGRFSSALSRSHELTQGHKWPLFGLTILMGVVFVLSSLPGIMAGDAAPAVGTYLEPLVEAAVGSYFAVVGAVVYHDLRILKEGPDQNAIAKVFE